MADNLYADLDQLLPQAGQRPVPDRLGRCEVAQEVAEIVGEGVKLKAGSVGGKRAARQAGPLDRALAFLKPLLAGAALIVEGDNVLRRSGQVGDDGEVKRKIGTSIPPETAASPSPS